MLVPVLSGDISIELVCDCLRDHGLVVIETTKAHAESIRAEAINKLDIHEGSEDGPRLIHLATKVVDGGFSDFLVHTGVCDFIPDEIQRVVVKAVLSWNAAGSPNIYFASVHS